MIELSMFYGVWLLGLLVCIMLYNLYHDSNDKDGTE